MTARAADALRVALSRFPFASGVIAILAVLTNLEIAGITLVSPENELRIVAAFAVAAAVSVAAALLAERESKRAFVSALAASAAGVVAGLVVWFAWNGLLFVPPFMAAAILVVPLAPHIARSNSLRFWTFGLWTGFGMSLGFVSVLLFVVGVSAILEMVRYLFGIGLGSRSYQHIYATALVLVGPLFALGRIPREFDEEATVGGSDRFTAGLATLQNWVATPLVLAAAVILHLYAAKILVTGEVPKNQIGWIVSVYAVLVLSLRLAAAPFITGGGGTAQRLFGVVWMPILIVPVLLLGYAVWLRVGAEGFTLERYYLALAALAAALIVLAQALPALRGDTRLMYAVPVLLLAASSFGPWGVASTVGRSQTALIARDFAAGPDGRLPSELLDETSKETLHSRVAALADVDELSRLQPLMSDEARARFEEPSSREAAGAAYLSALRLSYGVSPPVYSSFSADKLTPFDVSGFDLVQIGLGISENGPTIDAISQDPAATIQDRLIIVRFRGIVDRIDPKPIADRINVGNGDGHAAAEPAVVDATTFGGRTVRLRITYLGRVESANRTIDAKFDMALRSSEWVRPAEPLLGGDGQR